MTRTALVAIAVLAGASFVQAANMAPVVSAGPDTTIRVGYTFRFAATASDDGLPGAQLSLQWTQIAGPTGGAVIAVPDALQSLVTFTTVGAYKFALTANDGAIAVSDTVAVTVNAAIPFVVLSPVSGECVVTGTVHKITWQMDPPAGVRIELSTDDGVTYQNLTTAQIDGNSWDWQVSTSLAPSADCFIRITEYRNRSHLAQSAKFSLANSSAARRPDGGRAALAAQAITMSYSLDGRRFLPVAARVAGIGRAASAGLRVVVAADAGLVVAPRAVLGR